VHKFQRGGALYEVDLEGNSPRSSWVSRGWRLGLAAVGIFSAPGRPVVVLPGGSPAKVRGKTVSSSSDKAS
jgi:hypothetical protein